MNITLFEHGKKQRELVDQLEQNEGLLTPQLELEMKLSTEGVKGKVDAYFFTIEELKSRQEAWKQKKKDATWAVTFYENIIVSMKSRMEMFLKTIGETKILGYESKFSLVKTKKIVFISDESILPANYYKEVVTLTVDKELIHKDLSAGQLVPGAELLENHYLKAQTGNIEKKEISHE